MFPYVIYVLIAIALVVVPLVKARENRQLREAADTQHRQIESWAHKRGWKVTDGTDPYVIDDVERVSGLTGTPGDWTLGVGPGSSADPREAVPAKKWVYGTILRRAVPAGEIMIVGAWYEGESEHWVFASMQTDGTFEPMTIDHEGAQAAPHIEGAFPTGEDGVPLDMLSSLDGVPVPCRLRLLDRRILFRSPGWVTEEIVNNLVERMRLIDVALARPPGRGAQR